MQDWRDSDVEAERDIICIAVKAYIREKLEDSLSFTLEEKRYISAKTAEELGFTMIQTMRKGIPEDYR